MKNQIEDTLNGVLNEMVAQRPHAPIAWLSRRMRLVESPMQPALTIPVLDKSVGSAAIGADVEKAWAYALGMSGVPMPDVSGKPAAKSSSKSEGFSLSIETLGDGVFLSIR